MAIHKAMTVVEALTHQEVDPKGGRGCHMGSGFVEKDEAAKIARHLGVNEANLHRDYLECVDVFHTRKLRTKTKKQKGKRFGPCVFYDKKAQACTLKDKKPLYCKVTNTDRAEDMAQWYYLNYCVNADDPSSIREWKAYADTTNVIPGGRPEELVGNERLFQIMCYHDISLQPPTPTKSLKKQNNK